MIPLLPEERLVGLIDFEKSPIAPEVEMQIDGKSEVWLRKDALDFVKNLLGSDFNENRFLHADGWIDARIKFLESLTKQLTDSQPDTMKLKELEEDLGVTKKRSVNWKGFVEKHPTGESVADQINKENLDKLPEEEAVKSFESVRQTVSTEPVHVPPPQERIHYQPTGQNESFLVKLRSFSPGKVLDFFRSKRDKTSVVAQGTKKVASEIGKKSWGMMLKKGATALLAKLGIGAATGGVGAVALAVVDVAKKILNSEKLKNLGSKLMIAASAGIYFLWTNLTGLIMGSAGAFFAAPFGVGAMATGFGAGFALGMGLQNIAASLLGGTSTVVAPMIAPTAAASAISVGGFTIPAGLSSAATSFGAMFGGSGISSIVFFGIGGGIGALILSVTITLAAVLQQPEQQTGGNYEGPQNILTVKSNVVPEKLDNNSGAFVTYSIIITSSSDKDASLSFSINEVLQNKNGNTGITAPTVIGSLPSKIAAGETLPPINFNSYPVKVEYNDSDLVFTVRVTTGTEIQTASSLTRIGSPPVNNDQPFGYPASGNIVRFEDDTSHNGTFFNSSGGRYWVAGGMDIINHGVNTPVYSTTNGQVIFSGFDYGEDGHACTSPIPIVLPFKKCAVGGAIIVKSGNYIVSYLHLKESGLAKTTVTKGQIIGYMYEGQLPTSDAEHVHYQVLLNGANVPFGSSANDAGAPCTPQKILPEIATRKSVTQDGSGPFVCQ